MATGGDASTPGASTPGASTARRPSTRTAANARLTGLAGMVLLVLLAAQGVTVPGVRSMLTLHVFLGFAVIPPVLVKLGSTGYRALRYYRGDPAYRAAGPPQPALRVLAPLLIVLTVTVIASGAALVVGTHRRGGWLLGVHKLSFIAWFAVMTVHVLAYVWRAAGLAWADLRGRVAVPGRAVRLALVGAGIVAGVALGLATLGWAHHWHGGGG